jgi:hypothetical protein
MIPLRPIISKHTSNRGEVLDKLLGFLIKHNLHKTGKVNCVLAEKKEENELFRFLATLIKSESIVTGKMQVTTKCENVASSATFAVSGLEPCSNEETDY